MITNTPINSAIQNLIKKGAQASLVNNHNYFTSDDEVWGLSLNVTHKFEIAIFKFEKHGTIYTSEGLVEKFYLEQSVENIENDICSILKGIAFNLPLNYPWEDILQDEYIEISFL